jgi:hypothetical protein
MWPGRAAGQTVVLRPGPYTVEDLGPILESATLSHQYLFRSKHTGQVHLLLLYYGTEAIQAVDVNLDSGSVNVADIAPGRPGPNATVLHSNGKLYISSEHLAEYDPETGTARLIAKLAESAQYAIEGDDGAVYIGETTKGYVQRYDPYNGALENFGIMDDPGPPYYRYAYTLGADDRYVYVGMGQMPWYLVIYDRQSGEQKVYWKAPEQTKTITVYRGTTGGWFTQSPAGQWFRLEDGALSPLPPGKKPEVVPYSFRGDVLSEVAEWEKFFGYQVDLGEAAPDTGTGGLVTVRWRKKGEPHWRTGSASVRMRPDLLHRIYPLTETQLLVIPRSYAPLAVFNTVTGDVSVLGRTQRSLYDALSVDGVWFLAGYPAATLRWDPAKPWTLTYSTPNPSNPAVNPYMLPGFHKYHYYLAKGADGRVYVGVHHERDSVGGELGWYDAATSARGSLRQPFLKHDVRHLLAVAGGTKIVYSSVAIEPGLEAKLFVFDVASGTIEREITPLPGVSALDKLVEVAPGVVLGVVGTRFFKVDVRTGEVHYLKDLGGEAFRGLSTYDHRLILGPDGWVWLYIDNSISRIRPEDGVIERVLDAKPPQNLLFFNNDLYLYGTTSLRRIAGLFGHDER